MDHPDDDTPSEVPYGCRHCATRAAFVGGTARMPRDCPTLTHGDVAKDVAGYAGEDAAATMSVANDAPIDPEGRLRTRVEELVFFAKARGWRRIGVAFCVTLTREAQQLGRILSAAGLEPELVCCRVGAVDYDAIGLPKAHPERYAAICNPIAQARLLDARGADLIVNLGLCLGHDLLLQQTAKAPVTTLIVKDRVHDHNPILALREAPVLPG